MKKNLLNRVFLAKSDYIAIMKTQIIQLKDKRYLIAYKRRWWSDDWNYIERRFLSRANAEAYAKRFVWKVKHPRRYAKLLQKYPRERFTGFKY